MGLKESHTTKLCLSNIPHYKQFTPHYTPHYHLLLMPRKSGFPFHHLVIEDENMVWVYVESGFPTTLAVPNLMKRYFPNYEYSLCRRQTFLKLGGKL